MVTQLWDHQREALTALRQSIGQGVKRIVLQAPTGAGKSLIAAQIVDGALRKGNRLTFVVSHLSLIDQTCQMFYDEGIRDVSVLQASHPMEDWSKQVQIATIQTLASRKAYPKSQIVVFDECHVLHKFHKLWLKHPEWMKVPFIGLSATPWTRGLGKFFDSLLVVATTKELIAKGLLSKYKIFGVSHPDLSGVKTVAGDFHEGQLSSAMQRGTLVADIVETWKKRWGKDKTFLFAVDLDHAKTLQQRFLDAGISCAYQDAKTDPKERALIKKRFHAGEDRVIVNVGTLTIGVDFDVRCLIMARPTRSEMLYVQIVGRALRTAPGKDYAILLDHADNAARLGFPDEIHHDHLDDGMPRQKPEQKRALPKPCPQCDCMVPRKMGVCTNCGFTVKRDNTSGIIEEDGELVEITAGERRAKNVSRKFSMEEKARFFAGLKYIGVEKGYKPGWAARQFKEKLKVWPDHSIAHVAPQFPTMEVKNWVKSRMIAYAMGKKKAEARRA